jgi:hypothetical protein
LNVRPLRLIARPPDFLGPRVASMLSQLAEVFSSLVACISHHL